MALKQKWYVGHSHAGDCAFRYFMPPTHGSHGDNFFAVTGPFRTKRAATYMAKHGRNNPHCLTVSQAERIARRLTPRMP
jgi:hypothetical protein